MTRLKTALKWFAYGIGLGLLFAPRSGKETRQQLMQGASGYVSKAMNTGSQAVNQAAQKVDQAGSQGSSTMQQTGQQTSQQAGYTVHESSGSSGGTFSGGPA